MIDVPSARSSHLRPVVRGGGLAVGAGVTVGSAVGGTIGLLTGDITMFSAVVVIGLFVLITWCFSVLGFMDDLGSMSAGPRLVFQVLIAVLFAGALGWLHGHGLFAIAAVTLMVVSTVNAVNFMDGLNGLTASWTVVTGYWYAVVALAVDEPAAAVISTALAAAAAGFLPDNIGRARAFLGDVGSYGIGGSVAVLATYLMAQGTDFLLVGAPLLLLFFDVGLTLARRLYARENLFQAHRWHLYQKAQQAGLGHEQVAGVYSGLTLLSCLITAPLLAYPHPVMTSVVLPLLLVVVLIYANLPAMVRARAREASVAS
ncbi:hypothetical protein [Brevibacterium daeguense]|uniref:hypothetical protein n=1 Tax=Brevibacterium daeguense TaxID=909936 RepID=UPI001F21EAD7